MRAKKRKRIHRSSTLRRSLSLIAALVISVAAVSILSYFFLDDIYLMREKHDLKQVAEEISRMDFSDLSALEAELSDLEASHSYYLELYHPRDQLIYTTDTNNTSFDPDLSNEPTPLKPRIMRIQSHSDIDEFSYFETRQEYFASATYLVYGTQFSSGVAVEVYTPLEILYSNAQTAFWIVFIVAMFLFIIILSAFLYHTITFTMPVNQISRITRQIATMDFGKVCPPFRQRELDELSANINTLSSSLDMTMQTLKKRNEQLERDIENEQKMRESRKQFISNASHELKTPIAIIQGYAEGLKYGIYNDNPAECYDIILDEAQKMNQLVIDMLEVDRLNTTKIEPHYVLLPLKERIETFLEQMQNITTKNGIIVETEIDPSFVAYADEMLFERVFSNYFSNAISHCQGEKRIKVSCEVIDGRYRISVFNTGTPIAENDLGNIWSSFYRADKAHSRAEGRFGLGLSIVSSAQEAQQMLFGVVNRENGVEFWFDTRIAE